MRGTMTVEVGWVHGRPGCKQAADGRPPHSTTAATLGIGSAAERGARRAAPATAEAGREPHRRSTSEPRQPTPAPSQTPDHGAAKGADDAGGDGGDRLGARAVQQPDGEGTADAHRRARRGTRRGRRSDDGPGDLRLADPAGYDGQRDRRSGHPQRDGAREPGQQPSRTRHPTGARLLRPRHRIGCPHRSSSHGRHHLRGHPDDRDRAGACLRSGVDNLRDRSAPRDRGRRSRVRRRHDFARHHPARSCRVRRRRWRPPAPRPPG